MLFIGLIIVTFSNAQTVTSVEEVGENNLNTSLDSDITQSDMTGTSLNEQFDFLKDKPIDLNKVSSEELVDLFFLSPSQIKTFISYRNAMGYFIDFHELQSLPGWDLSLLRVIRPYVYVSTPNDMATFINSNLKNQKSLFLLRYSNSFIKRDSMNNHSLAFRYNYDSKKNISIGINGENDTGENFEFTKNKKGFDFASGYFNYKGNGLLKSLIVGDYLINLGQGLIHWQSAGFNKGASVDCIKRQGSTLKPYHSFGEFNFLRGVALQLKKKDIVFVSFLSSKKMDAYTNFDSAIDKFPTISSFDYSGLHNSISSLQRKSNSQEFAGGCSIQHQKPGLVLGLNFIHYRYSLPIKPTSALPYALFSFRGQKLTNMSFHYSKTINNFHFFGELASDLNHVAAVNGTIFSISEKVELSFLYRMISRSYHSFYSNAFTAQSKPVNETGFYTGFGIKFSRQIQLNGFVDYYKFPWLTYSVNSPSVGSEIGLTMIYMPTKKAKLIFFYGHKKGLNFQSGNESMIARKNLLKNNYKADVDFFISKSFTVKTRFSLVHLKTGIKNTETGVLSFVDFHYKPIMKPFSVVFRMFSFESDGYDSRIYAYENDIMYSYSINSFYGSGKGFYINSNYKINKKIRLEAKWTMISKEINDFRASFDWQKSLLKLQILAFF